MGGGVGGGAVSRRLFGYVHGGGGGRSCVFDYSTGQSREEECFLFSLSWTILILVISRLLLRAK